MARTDNTDPSWVRAARSTSTTIRHRWGCPETLDIHDGKPCDLIAPTAAASGRHTWAECHRAVRVAPPRPSKRSRRAEFTAPDRQATRNALRAARFLPGDAIDVPARRHRRVTNYYFAAH